ncbi:hypothetical protein MMC25_008315 [Agyrium rufum]|nr:hypothetical protein [Agyrium rufum]
MGADLLLSATHSTGAQTGSFPTLQGHDVPGRDENGDENPPPAYSGIYGKVDVSHDGLNTVATVASDGRVDIRIDQKSRRLSNLLGPALRSQVDLISADQSSHPPPGYIPPALGGVPGQIPPPPLNVVIHVVGSRGDVQPFVALGQVLKNTYGHRVRLATHPVFKDFIEENGLEFFSIGGDPAELMAFMVKNPGLMPGKDALKSGDIGKRRKGMYEIVKGCWRSCFEAGDGTGVPVSDDRLDERASFDSGISLSADSASKPFVADAIIANPPSFAHVHCAEKMGIPLHLMFTMPWSPTQAFPHPLANIQSTNADVSMTNFLSYALVEMMTWQGLGDIINRFREKSLGLEPVSLMWAPGMASRMRIPYTYCWSPSLIPKPKDWAAHISISGFYFLSLAQNYTPDPALKEFLDAGPPPVYIGFGSIVVDDPNVMTHMIFEAVKLSGQRALVSKGWGGLGADDLDVPEGIFMLGDVPHDWLFKHVSCVIHHGGAGTTAAGIATGRPTVIVPFFGDQPFWGAMVAKAGAGPTPVPYKHLTAAILSQSISEALKPAVLERARELGQRISHEKGADQGGKCFHDSLDVDGLRCALAPSRAAVWRVKRTKTRLSAFAAATLGNAGLLDFNNLKLYRPKEYDTEDGPWDPITGGASALIGTLGSLMMGVADFPLEILHALQSKPGEKATSVSEVTPSTATATLGTTSPKEHSATSMRYSIASSPDHSEASSVHQVQIEQEEMSSPHSPFDKSQKPLMSPRIPLSPRSSSMSQRNFSFDTAIDTSKGIGRIVGVGLKSPMDFTLNIARGFHNAPKLYGDTTLRPVERVTGIQSGLKAAGKVHMPHAPVSLSLILYQEFGYGMYDGISGLVTQPMEGAKKEGFAGLIKGFGKGIGGVVLKPGAAAWGLPGYTFKGIYKELQKHLGTSVQNYIIAARTVQGFEDWQHSNEIERADVIQRWQLLQTDRSNQKKARQQRPHPAHAFGSFKSKLADHKRSASPSGATVQSHQDRIESPPMASTEDLHGDETTSTSSLQGLARADSDAYERAIRISVAATSRGDSEQDVMIERAIRASVQELRNSLRSPKGEAVERVVQASVTEASRSTDDVQEAEYQRQLERAIHQSLQGGPSSHRKMLHAMHNDWNDSGIDTDDEEMEEIVKRSTQTSAAGSGIDDGELHRAIEESQKHHEQLEADLTKERKEEEIVMEYVKRQSLVEQMHKSKLDNSGMGP